MKPTKYAQKRKMKMKKGKQHIYCKTWLTKIGEGEKMARLGIMKNRANISFRCTREVKLKYKYTPA